VTKDRTLETLVELSPGFNTAVDLDTDLEREAKIAGYIPTDVAGEIFLDMGENLHVSASRRARVITGTYGTGKSHLALVLARLYRDGVDIACVGPVLQKLKGKSPGKAAKLVEERSRLAGKFLLVLLNGDRWGAFDDSLLYQLDQALKQAGMEDLLPKTAYDAALARVEELREHHSDVFKRMESLVKEYDLQSVEVLTERLKNKQREAYDTFCQLHKELFAGARFYQHHLMSAADVYAAVTERLVRERGYAGIIVIWDEFGRYMERVVADPRGIEGQSIQDFAQKGCNNSHRNQVHLYLICHRSLQEYVRISTIMRTSGMSRTDEEEWNKINGRFRQFDMKTTDLEVFQLMDQVVMQKDQDTAWHDFVAATRDYMEEWTDTSRRLKIFPEFTTEQIHKIVTLGIYPLHPMAAFCLPRISQRVAQNERTMFRFLSDSGADTLGPFLRETVFPAKPGRPPCLPAERLWTFFEQSVRDHPIYRRIAGKLDQADTKIDPDDIASKRIVRAVALLQVIGTDRAPCTEDVLAFTLACAPADREALREKLKMLCTKSEKAERVLVQSVKDGAYRFTGAASDDFEAKIDQMVRDGSEAISPAMHLASLSQELGIESAIPATGYSDDFLLARALDVQFADARDFATPQKWLSNLGAGSYRDGYAIIGLCADGGEIRAAEEAAKTQLKHPQIAVAIPKEPVGRLVMFLRRHQALRSLERTQAALYAEGADLREEWEQQYRDHLDAIANEVKPLLDPERRLLGWYFQGEERERVNTRARLREAVSDMMYRVFPMTPKIAHERLTTEEGNDNFRGARRSIIDKLLQQDGPTLLGRETHSQQKTVITFVYRKNGILRPTPTGFVLDRPEGKEYQGAAKVWDEIEAFIEQAKKSAVNMTELVGKLRQPPFGVRTRSIPLIAAAVFRKYIQRGNLALDYRRSTSSSQRISRLDGTSIDDAVLSAEKYQLVYVDYGEKHEAILTGIADAFGVNVSQTRDLGDLVVQLSEAICNWWRSLPQFAQRSNSVSNMSRMIREGIIKPLAQGRDDAQEILLNVTAEAIQPGGGKDQVSRQAVADLFSQFRAELQEAVTKLLMGQALNVVAQVFTTREAAQNEPQKALKTWFLSLPEERRNLRVAGDASSVIKYARTAAENDTPAGELVVGLARQITGMSLEDWGDDMLERFRGRLESAKRTIEETEPPQVSPTDQAGTIVMTPPKKGQVCIMVSDGSETVRRTFVPVADISIGGQNLKKIIEGAVEGIRRSLPSGETETILVSVIRDLLK